MTSPTPTTTPTCVGIIMDGNRRFAKEQGLPSLEGHLLGYAKAKEVVRWCKAAGIQNVILYAFSTENWNRTPEEVSYLIEIFTTLLVEVDELRKDGEAVRFIGDIDRFGTQFAEQVHQIETTNPSDPTLTTVVALSYGGRAEILHALESARAQTNKGPITEAEFEKHLWTTGIPDPDMVIRTGGEMRLSNFLPWQAIYSELFFTNTYWPALTQEELLAILNAYSERQRRRGK